MISHFLSDARILRGCQVLRQWNATRPLCQLPLELKGYILQILAAIDPPISSLHLAPAWQDAIGTLG
ncbi:hypothetical protein EVG20_g4925 [Dentipellis fragilis]|uniref:Uncharacterized protein n=1 Tax=Dentipellis fragilis TaxID=205917 RepID=A0A4Y9YWY6_9AGAM|nr:hypothetical protein EVG20_g4925 [Dentipellis fragilis]